MNITPATTGTGRFAQKPCPAVRLVAILVFLVLAPALPSWNGTAAGQSAGFSAAGLARVDSALAAYVDSGRIGGAVLLVLKDGRIAIERSVGWADKDSGWRMGADAIFRIASQTKALTSTAIMMLAEEKKLSIDDEAGKYLPSFAQTTVAVKTDTGLAVVTAGDPITIRHLLTHTSGISYGTDSAVGPLYAAQGLGPAAGNGWYTADKTEPICTTVEKLARLPFVAEPGTQFVYGYSSDVLGCIVEKVAGMSLDEFFRKRILNPLKMRDTYFFLPPEKARRLATVYMSDAEGRARRAPAGAKGQGDYVTGPRVSYSGGAGLLSTARDYSRFLQMLLNGGEFEGVKLLKGKSVDQMTRNQVDDLYGTGGMGFGLGFEIVDRAGAQGAFPEGTFGWGGAYGSRYVVVPSEKMVIVLMSQLMPNGTDFLEAVPDLVYRALAAQGQ